MRVEVALLAGSLVVFAAGCRQSAPLHDLPTSHLSTDLGSEALKPPEQRHHMAWQAAAPSVEPTTASVEPHVRAEDSRRSLATHRSRVPKPPVTVVPSTPHVDPTSASDPWARFRPQISAAYDRGP
jgi:hypothetical protein